MFDFITKDCHKETERIKELEKEVERLKKRPSILYDIDVLIDEFVSKYNEQPTHVVVDESRIYEARKYFDKVKFKHSEDFVYTYRGLTLVHMPNYFNIMFVDTLQEK